MYKQISEGIWSFQELLPFVPSSCRITLNECHTPVKKVDNIWFKCEYKNPNGSWKDRGMVYQVAKLMEKSIKEAVISSSGNAAISAAAYCSLASIKLTVFVSPKINKGKLELLKKNDNRNLKIIEIKKPLSASIQYANKIRAYNLRQSKDKNGTIGYETIAYELKKEIPQLDSVFLAVSSGTALVGIAEGFKKCGFLPAIHAVQTEAVNPIASIFDKNFCKKDKSLADAIVARFTVREDEVINIIRKSKGWGWVISDNEMKKARSWLIKHDLDCSYEGAATFAAWQKAKRAGYIYKNPVCILSGRYYR
uniref:PLP-dependent lyase/thiolase n=1 Tax=candidate division CPR3 bacterium TaxID=2268181 RepID=A0A7C4QXE7_UNCC3